MTRGKIPDRWEEYEAVGKVIKGTRFISFKVPLNKHLSLHLAPGVERFTPQDLPRLMTESNLELGLVIDLTNTTRYYDCQDIVTEGIGYEKIFTAGHHVPSKKVQESFFRAVDNFLASNGNNDRLIGVHCTHGLNRTGYLVCRYMIDKLEFTPDDAIKAFNEARGHEIERENYLNDLRGKLSIEENEEGSGQIKTNCMTPLKADPGRVEHADYRLEQSIDNDNNTRFFDRCLGQSGTYNEHRNERLHRFHRNGPYSHGSEYWRQRSMEPYRYDGRNWRQSHKYNDHGYDFTSNVEATSSHNNCWRNNDYHGRNQNDQHERNFYSSWDPNTSWRSFEDYGKFGRNSYGMGCDNHHGDDHYSKRSQKRH